MDAPDLDADAGSDWAAGRSYATVGRLELPSMLAGYRLIREIASGGMGVVYEAEDMRLKRRVALKMLRTVAFARPEELARFQVEAELTAQLDHPNIVPIYKVGEVDGMPFFTMRLIKGCSLGAKLAAAGAVMPACQTAALMAKVARAVQHAHERGVLHRDLKPGNILLDDRGEPHLTDFGLAKLLDDDSSLTRSNVHLGTPHYMSPEQASGRAREVTTASDVWALGVLLYQMLTLKLPFTGETTAEVMHAIQRTNPAALPGVAMDLVTLVSRCLEKESGGRLRSAGFLAEELERWLAGQPILSRPMSSWEHLKRWVRQNRVMAWAVAISGAGLMVGGGAALWQWREAVAARDEARTDYRDATDITDLLGKMLVVFDSQHGGPVMTKEELLNEFFKCVEAFEGDPQRQIALITQTGTLMEQAEVCRSYRKAVAMAGRVLSPDHPQLWYLRWRAASTQPGDGPGHEKRMVPELRRVYEWHCDHLGGDHPHTIRTMHSLGRILIFADEQEEGLQLMEKVKTALEQQPHDPLLPAETVHTDYMQALFQNGRLQEALAVGRENCLRAVAAVSAANSHETGRAFQLLAKYCRKAGLKDEAVVHIREALKIYWRFEGPASKDAMESVEFLLSLLREKGDDKGVLATQQDTLRAFDLALGPSRPETHHQVAAYARTLAEMGRSAEADALYTLWLDRLRESDGSLAPQAAELKRLHAEFVRTTRR